MIPLDLVDNRIYLPVKVNGSRPLTFILDTGASLSALNLKRARETGLRLRDLGEQINVGAGEGRTTVFTSKDVALRVAESEFTAKEVLVTPLDELETLIGRPVDGILGYEFLSRYVVEVNYAARTATIHDQQTYQYSGKGEIIPIRVTGGQPILLARISFGGRDPIEGPFHVDSGMTKALSFKRPFVDKHQLLAGARNTFPCPSFGVGGEVRCVCGRAQTLRIGNLVISDVVAEFSQAATGATANTSSSGLIGGEILRRFTVVFDYVHKRMILEPNEYLTEPYELDMSGTIMIADGRDFKTRKVYRVLAGSPAAEAGLREGDLLVSIEDRPAAEFTLEQIRRMFKQDGRVYALEIKRGEQLLQFRIKLRRLV